VLVHDRGDGAWYREREGERLAWPGAHQPLQLRAAGLVARQLSGLVGRVV
jgi:hypothetical protein